MTESASETPSPVEAPKPGSLAAVRERLGTALVSNVEKATDASLGENERARAERLHRMQTWQIDMLDSLATSKAYEEINTTGNFNPDKAARTMTALEGFKRLERWIEQVLDNPDRKKDPDDTMPDSEAREYAEDLKAKLIDEASRAN